MMAWDDNERTKDESEPMWMWGDHPVEDRAERLSRAEDDEDSVFRGV